MGLKAAAREAAGSAEQDWGVGARAMAAEAEAAEAEAASAEKDWVVGAMAEQARGASEEQGWGEAGSAAPGWEGVGSARVELGSVGVQREGPTERQRKAQRPAEAVMAAAALGLAAAA